MQSKAQIDQVLRQKSEAKEIPGVVAVAATGKDVIYEALSASATSPRAIR